MKQERETIVLKISDEFILEIEGTYIPEVRQVMYYKDGSGYPGDPPDFEIENIEIIKGTIMDLIDYLNYNLKNGNIWEFLTNKCLEELGK
jgi:hypothetical protein